MDADDLAWTIAQHMRAQEGEQVIPSMSLEACRAGYARVALDVTPAMLNGHKTLHGGIIFTLADAAFAYACNSRNEAAVAAQVSIIFLSPGHPGDRLVAEAVEQSVQGRSAVYTITVRAAGRIVATLQALSRTIGHKLLPET